MRRGRSRHQAHIEPNLTSLIDVTFLLIVFFVLVSKVAEVEMVDMDLPTPIDPATLAADAEHQVVVNVMPGESGAAAGYRVGLRDFPAGQTGHRAMAAYLATLYAADPRLHINIRADRATHYEHIEPVLEAVSTAARQGAAAAAGGRPRVNLMVIGSRT